MTDLRIAPAARADLRDIRTYSKDRFGAAATKRYLAGLQDTFDLLVARPRIGAAREKIAPGLRQFPYKSHRIFFRDGGSRLLIVRILHHARDIADAFLEQQ